MQVHPPTALALVRRWSHLTASSGYDRLAREVGARVMARPESQNAGFRLCGLVWQRLHRASRVALLDYQFGDWLAEWAAVFRARLSGVGVVHAMHADMQLGLLMRWRHLLPCPLVATFHLPASHWRIRERFEKFHKNPGRVLDAVIVLSRAQLPDFRNWFGQDKVFYIPHGIDVQTFTPGAGRDEPQRLRLVTVGDMLRDWEVLHRVIDGCQALQLPVEFDVVTRRQCWPYLTGCRHTRLHEGISEAALVALYRQADAVLMPMIDATANNAILEAMACGTPVIASRVGGLPDYVDDNCGWLLAKDETEIAATLRLIQELCRDRGGARAKRLAARQQAERFTWTKVAQRTTEIYRAVARGAPLDTNRDWA